MTDDRPHFLLSSDLDLQPALRPLPFLRTQPPRFFPPSNLSLLVLGRSAALDGLRPEQGVPVSVWSSRFEVRRGGSRRIPWISYRVRRDQIHALFHPPHFNLNLDLSSVTTLNLGDRRTVPLFLPYPLPRSSFTRLLHPARASQPGRPGNSVRLWRSRGGGQDDAFSGGCYDFGWVYARLGEDSFEVDRKGQERSRNRREAGRYDPEIDLRPLSARFQSPRGPLFPNRTRRIHPLPLPLSPFTSIRLAQLWRFRLSTLVRTYHRLSSRCKLGGRSRSGEGREDALG
jgi:hypothetical protein